MCLCVFSQLFVGVSEAIIRPHRAFSPPSTVSHPGGNTYSQLVRTQSFNCSKTIGVL